MPVEIIVPVPSVQIPLLSSTRPTVSLDHPLRRDKKRGNMPRRSSDSTDTAGEREGRKRLFKELVPIAELWIACGHDVSSQEFMTAMAQAFVQLPNQQGKSYPIVSVGLGKQFFRQYSALETQRKEAKRARGGEYSHDYWLSQLKEKVLDKSKFSPERVYATIEYGFITEFDSLNSASTCFRPRLLERQPHSLTSGILLISMAGEFFPFRAIMKVPNESPMAHRRFHSIEIATSKKGWATDEDWVDWVEHFDKQTKQYLKSPNERRLLFVDAHHCPITKDFFLKCFQRGIICVAYPKPPNLDKFDPFRRGGICVRINKFFRNWASDRLESARGNEEERVKLRMQSFAGLVNNICFKSDQIEEGRIMTLRAWKKSPMYYLLDQNCKASSTTSRGEVRNAMSIRQRVQPQEPRPQTSGGDRDAVVECIIIDSDGDDEIPIHTSPSTSSSSGDSSASDSTIGNSDREFQQRSSRGRSLKRSWTPMTSRATNSPVSSHTRSRRQQGETSRQEPGSPCPPNHRRRLSYGNPGRAPQTPRVQSTPQARPRTTEQRPPTSHRLGSSDDDDSSDFSDSMSPDRPQFSSDSRNHQSRDNYSRNNQSRIEQSRHHQPRNSRSRENLRLAPRTPREKREKIIANYQRSKREMKKLIQETHEQGQAIRAFLANSASP